MKNRKMKIFLWVLTLVILMSGVSVVNADPYTSSDSTGLGNSNPWGESNTVDSKGYGLNSPYSGIEYTIEARNASGKIVNTFIKRLSCGTEGLDPNDYEYAGGIQGYGVTGATDMDSFCPIPQDGVIEITLDDIKEFLAKNDTIDEFVNKGKTSWIYSENWQRNEAIAKAKVQAPQAKAILEKIKNEEVKSIRLIARSYLNIVGKGGSDRSFTNKYWTEIIDMWYGNEYATNVGYMPNQTETLHGNKGGIYEENRLMWGNLANQIGSKRTVCCCPNCKCDAINDPRGYIWGNPKKCLCGCGCDAARCYNKYMGWFAVEYKIGPEDTLMEIQPEERQPVVYANVENSQFNLYSSTDVNGNPIPGLEPLQISGESNVYGYITGLEKYGTEVKDAVLNGTVKAEYYVYDSVSKTLKLETAQKTYNGATTGWITWLDASNYEYETNTVAEFSNDVWGENATLSKTLGRIDRHTPEGKELRKGEYTPKGGTQNYTYGISESEKAEFNKLLELAKAGSAWANEELITRTRTMKAEAEEKIKEITPFFNVGTDIVTFTIEGKTFSERIDRNGTLAGPFYVLKYDNKKTKGDIANKSANGAHYETTGIVRIGPKGKTPIKTYTIPSVHHTKMNNIRLHTPINCELLINGEKADKVSIMPGEDFDISMPFDSTSTYYKAIANWNTLKYVDSIKLTFKTVETDGTEKVIGKPLVVKKEDIKTDKANLITQYAFKSITPGTQCKIDVEVIAINANAVGANTNSVEEILNAPDNVYALKTGITLNGRKGSYDLTYKREKECKKTPTAIAQIKNDTFKPEKGFLIPTSESLYVKGETDLAGQISGIEEWELSFTDDYEEYVYIKGTYSNKSGKEVTEGKWILLNKASCPNITYTVTTDATVTNKVDAYIKNKPLGGTKSKKSLATPYLSIVQKGILAGDNRERVIFSNIYDLGNFNTLEELNNALNNYQPQVKHFWKIVDDEIVIEATKDGVTSQSTYTNNCPVLTTDFANISKTPIEGSYSDLNQENIPLIPNGTYESKGWLISSGVEYKIKGRNPKNENEIVEDVNPITVYTPISNIISVSKDTLKIGET